MGRLLTEDKDTVVDKTDPPSHSKLGGMLLEAPEGHGLHYYWQADGSGSSHRYRYDGIGRFGSELMALTQH